MVHDQVSYKPLVYDVTTVHHSHERRYIFFFFYYLDEFNRIFLDFNNIDFFFFKCLLPHSFEHFVDTMLYGFGRDSISVGDVKDALNSKELNKKIYENWGKNQADDLVARIRSKENSSSNREKSNQSLDMDSITTVKRKDIGQMNADYSKRKRRKSVLLILVM